MKFNYNKFDIKSLKYKCVVIVYMRAFECLSVYMCAVAVPTNININFPQKLISLSVGD